MSALAGYNLASAGAGMETDGRGAARRVVRRRPAGGAGPPGGRAVGHALCSRAPSRSRSAPAAGAAPTWPRRAREDGSSAAGAEHGSRGGRRARERAGALLASDPRADERRRRRRASLHRRSPRLAAQLDALDRAGFTAVGGDALVSHVLRGSPLPHKPVLLTFDDGSAGQYTRALPILRRHHFVATFFVMTVVLDKPGWLSRGEVRDLDRAGMTIAAHTWDHHPVTQYTEADWQRQLIEPRDELARIVGHPVRLFAYPDGLWTR